MRPLHCILLLLFLCNSLSVSANHVEFEDIDNDGVPNSVDASPNDNRISIVIGGGREFTEISEYWCSNSNVPETVARMKIINNSNYVSPEACEYENYAIPSGEDTIYEGWHNIWININDTRMGFPTNFVPEQNLPEHCVRAFKNGGGPDYLWIAVGQLNQTESAVIHCITEGFDDFQNTPCKSRVFFLDQSENITFSNLEFTCTEYTNNREATKFSSQIGAFGDLNKDGLLDFVRGDTDGVCEIYLAVSLGIFSSSQSLDSGCYGPITIVDVDFDGELDIVDSRGVSYLNGTNLLVQVFLPEITSQSSWVSVAPYDLDSDGDLDLVRKFSTDLGGRNNVITEEFLNTWEPDDDADGVPNSKDICPDTDNGVEVGVTGCDPTIHDSDGDSVVDAFDLCDSTPSNQLSTLDQDGCSWEQRDDDGDFVLNIQDACPDTDPSQTAEPSGCSWEQYDADNDGVMNGNDDCPETYGYMDGQVDDKGCWVEQNSGSTDGLFLILGILGLLSLGLIISKSRNSNSSDSSMSSNSKTEIPVAHSSSAKSSIDLGRGAKVAGNLAKSAGSIFQGMHQLQRGNIGGAFKSFSNAASNPLSGTTKFEQAEIADQSVSTIGKSTYTCQNPACNYQFANVSDAKMIGNAPERCPSCNTPVMKDMPWNGENPVQNSISDLGKVTYACMQPTCTYEVGPVPKGTSVGRCMNCGGPMKKKSIY